MRASCYPRLLKPCLLLCIRQLKLPDRFVNGNHRILLAMHKSAIQASWRRLDLPDCSQIGPQQSVVLGETPSVACLSGFFQSVQNGMDAFGALTKRHPEFGWTIETANRPRLHPLSQVLSDL